MVDPKRMDLVADIRDWCRRASWLARLPLFLLLAYWAVRHVGDPHYSGLIDGLNFGIHELGHVVFSPFGQFMAVAGGSLLQCIAPLVAGAMFFRQRDYFAIVFALGWFATNLFDVAVYVGDARARSLPLVGLGAGEPLHDWFFLLGRMDLLNADTGLAALLRVGGGAVFVVTLALGGWLLFEMWSGARGEHRSSVRGI